jgi:hypothetical protein
MTPEGFEPTALLVRRATVGWKWRIGGRDFDRLMGRFSYVHGWRPTKAGAERSGKRRYGRLERRYRRRNGWADMGPRAVP